jgi:transposase InsO family protein
MLHIHPNARNARTTPAVRAEIARSREPTGVLAQRYGISTETVRNWRRRGPGGCADHSSRPRRLRWRATPDERRIVCLLRRETRFPLDDLTAVVRHFLPHLSRDAIYRILKANRLARLADLPPAYALPHSRKGTGHFKDYDLGFVHLDAKHLPALRTADGQVRRRYLFIAIDRCSRAVHLAVKDDLTQRSAIAFLREVVRAVPFRVRIVLTDRGASFKAIFQRACRALGVEHRRTRPYTPQTNGMAERFNGRVEREVLTITVGNHPDLERLLLGYNTAYNLRRQRVLRGRSPADVVAERLRCRPELANSDWRPGGADALVTAMAVVATAKDGSQPDS